MKKRIHDSLGKAARRRKQIQTVLGDVDPSTTTTTDVALGLSESSARLKTYSEQRKPLAVATNSAATLLTANVAYRNALLHRGDVVENPAQVELRKSIEVAESKDAAREAFLLVAHSAPDLISSQSIRSLCQTLLKLDVQSRMGTAAYHTALADVSGSGEDRWSAVKPEEEATFLRYQTRQLERYATHGSSRSPELEWLSEGADNNTVAVLNHQLQRHAERSVPISSEVWMDLMRLDISWSSALRIFDRVRSQDAGVLPPVEMSTRVMALMTGYKTNGLGSRPWKEALRMYHDVLQSGYDVEVRTHTAALDALWRSADNFVQPHRSVSEAHKEMIASSIKEIRQRCEVEERKRIAGEDGCAYVEGLVKAMSAAGQWQAAMEVLSSTDLAATDASFRMLVPTPESYAFVMAACHVQGHAAHAIALREIFNASGWTLRSLHPEVLQVYLQSLRNVVRRIPSIGKDVEELIGDGYGLDRPCSIACLQLLSSIFVETKQPKEEVAEKVVRQFLEKNVWLQQPLARKVELQTVFRCMFLISTARSRGGSAAPSSLAYLETYLSDVFGPSSPELEWFRDAEIYGLRCTRDWKYALDLFHRIVECRPPSHLKYLPIPLRQAKVELLATLLACSKGRSASGEEQEFLLDDEAFDAYTRESEEVAAIGVQRASDLFDWEEVVPHAMVGELVLEQADSMRSEEDGVDGEASQQSKRALALTAMRHFAFAPSHDLSPGMYRMLGRFLGLAETHVESTMVEGHARLLGNVLRTLDSGRTVGKAAPLEAYLC